MAKRPMAVTVFGWFWRVGGIMGMILAWPLAIRGREWFGDLAPGPFWRLPPILLLLYRILISSPSVVAGNGLLKGRNWSRALALVICSFALVAGAVGFERTPLFWFDLLTDMAFTLLMAIFLFRADAKDFFTLTGLGSPSTRPPTAERS